MARRRFNPKPPKVVPGAAAAADARAAAAASRVASINLQAMTGRAGIKQGDRVMIGSGLGAGELATVESVVGGVIPAAVVRLDSGMTRRARTIDLTPAPASAPPQAAPAVQAQQPAPASAPPQAPQPAPPAQAAPVASEAGTPADASADPAADKPASEDAP